jgi:hypothetical protein
MWRLVALGSSPTFWNNALSSSSGPKIKPSNHQQANSKQISVSSLKMEAVLS